MHEKHAIRPSGLVLVLQTFLSALKSKKLCSLLKRNRTVLCSCPNTANANSPLQILNKASRRRGKRQTYGELLAHLTRRKERTGGLIFFYVLQMFII